MMLDDGLRLCSGDDVDGLAGGSSLRLGTTHDLGARFGSSIYSADPSGGVELGCFIRVTETFSDAAGVSVLGFAVMAHREDSNASAIASTARCIGQSELLGGTVPALTWIRAFPAAGDDIYFRLNPSLLRTDQSAPVHTNGLTYTTANDFPRYVSLVAWVMGVPSYTAISGAMDAGKIDAWLTDKVPTVSRSGVDLSSYRS